MIPTRHTERCMCPTCMHDKLPALRSRSVPTVSEALIVERARSLRSDSAMRLDTYQRRLLDTFTKRWNADRAARGLSPVAAHDALTQGLESLIAMIGQE